MRRIRYFVLSRMIQCVKVYPGRGSFLRCYSKREFRIGTGRRIEQDPSNG
jgi:hypothetical protein